MDSPGIDIGQIVAGIDVYAKEYLERSDWPRLLLKWVTEVQYYQ